MESSGASVAALSMYVPGSSSILSEGSAVLFRFVYTGRPELSETFIVKGVCVPRTENAAL